MSIAIPVIPVVKSGGLQLVSASKLIGQLDIASFNGGAEALVNIAMHAMKKELGQAAAEHVLVDVEDDPANQSIEVSGRLYFLTSLQVAAFHDLRKQVAGLAKLDDSQQARREVLTKDLLEDLKWFVGVST